MNFLFYVSYFFGGMFLANSAPHLISAVLGRPFQSPFAKPRGQGLSSAKVNLLWGTFNLIVAYLLLCRVGAFELRSGGDVIAAGMGAFLISYFAAHHFGALHGGDLLKR